MSKVILATAFGSRLNLNGDQGNLLVLRNYLRAAGFSVEIVSANDTASALRSHFLLLGHGSAAAMSSLEQQLGAIDWLSVISSTPGLAVGSGFEWLVAHGYSAQQVNAGERESEFQVAQLGSIEVLGYRNTDSGLPNLVLNQAFMCSMLHGPLLAKNPQLLDRAARAAVTKAGLTWPAEVPETLRAWVAMLNEVCDRIWQLEAERHSPKLSL